MVRNAEIEDISLDGGTLCLDYINTVHNRLEEAPSDYLFNVLDLILWARKVELLDEIEEIRLEEEVERDVAFASTFFEDTIQLRELLHTIFLTLSQGKPLKPADLDRFNSYLALHFSQIKLQQHNVHDFRKNWSLPDNSLFKITAPVINDAYELLLSDKLHRVKECPNCGWLFLDTTKNGKRRWCSMKNCGSNVKALAWYNRHKQREEK